MEFHLRMKLKCVCVCLTVCLWLCSPFVGPWPPFLFLNPIPIGWTPLQGHYLHIDQHKHRINAHRHLCFEWYSNPWSQRSSERRQFIPETARPLWSAWQWSTLVKFTVHADPSCIPFVFMGLDYVRHYAGLGGPNARLTFDKMFSVACTQILYRIHWIVAYNEFNHCYFWHRRDTEGERRENTSENWGTPRKCSFIWHIFLTVRVLTELISHSRLKFM
jgi:hypothetical protein